jgi:hypothetical protein
LTRDRFILNNETGDGTSIVAWLYLAILSFNLITIHSLDERQKVDCSYSQIADPFLGDRLAGRIQRSSLLYKNIFVIQIVMKIVLQI